MPSATGRRKPKNNGWDIKTHPVVDVSWDDALAYTRWLGQQTGMRYRLLSEAEWEYVARAGTTTSYWWGTKPGSNNAHCFDCKSDYNTSKPAKVGTYKPNPFGLFDTAGNVYEWVHDCYHRNYRDAPTDGSVWEGGDCDRACRARAAPIAVRPIRCARKTGKNSRAARDSTTSVSASRATSKGSRH